MTDFHNESMRLATQRVLDRARINKRKTLYHNLGGYANQRQRLRPTTTAQMPLYMNGNNTFPTGGDLTGGFRTQAGQSYGMDLLQRRAKQLELMAMTDEEKQLLPKEQPIPLSEISEDKIAFDLLLSELENFVDTGNILQLRLPDVRRLITLFRKFMFDIGFQELTEYFNTISNLIVELRNVISSGDEGIEQALSQRRFISATDARTLNIFNFLSKLRGLIKVVIASINKDPKQRKTFVNQFIKEIFKQKVGSENILKSLDRALKQIEGIPMIREPESENRQRTAPVDVDVDIDEAEQFLQELERAETRQTEQGFFGEGEDEDTDEDFGAGAWAEGYSRLQRLRGTY